MMRKGKERFEFFFSCHGRIFCATKLFMGGNAAVPKEKTNLGSHVSCREQWGLENKNQEAPEKSRAFANPPME